MTNMFSTGQDFACGIEFVFVWELRQKKSCLVEKWLNVAKLHFLSQCSGQWTIPLLVKKIVKAKLHGYLTIISDLSTWDEIL